MSIANSLPRRVVSLSLLVGAVVAVLLLMARPAEAATAEEVQEASLYMLELINEARTEAGLDPVVLGDSPVAQEHANAMLEGCFSGHWGLDGLKPYMRYSVAGGYQDNGENVVGLDYCLTSSDGFRTIEDVQAEIRRHMEALLASEEHGATIMSPFYRKVNIGLAWDVYNLKTVQLFEGDYVLYESLPAIRGSVLELAGSLRGRGEEWELPGFNFHTLLDTGEGGDRDPKLSVDIYYDPTPHALTAGQVARTYCYDSGRLVASVRPPAGEGYYYEHDEFPFTYEQCPSPYDVPVDTPAPASYEEANAAWQSAYDQGYTVAPITVPWLTASHWEARLEEFAVEVDIHDLLTNHGEGVYTVHLWQYWGEGEDFINIHFSQYSIFYASTGSVVGDQYDANRTGVIDKAEVIAAFRDYVKGQLTKAQIIEVFRLYVAG